MTEADRELSIAGARLRIRDEGAGPAVLLIHGWTLDLDMWEPQARELSDAWRIIRYDRRGFGLSTGNPSIADDFTDVPALCEQLGVTSVALVGMSQGARVAAQVAAQHPKLVSGVVFDGAPPGTLADGGAHHSDIPLTRYRALAQAGRLDEFRQEWRKHPLTKLQSRDARTRSLLERMLERYRGEDLRSSDVGTPLPAPRPEAIRVPVLIISGAFDLESRFSAAAALARALSASERAIIPRAGHLPNLDNPTAYNTQLRRFLARLQWPA